ncbi:MAG: DUF126 domain-containing protein [Nitrososphaeria archaeon]
MNKIILEGRSIIEGKLFGELMISRKPLSFLGGIDMITGKIVDHNNNLYGKQLAGKIFYLPTSIGSTVGAFVIYKLYREHLSPKAILCEKADTMLVTGCAITNVPLIDSININRLPKADIIKNCEIDGNKVIIIED